MNQEYIDIIEVSSDEEQEIDVTSRCTKKHVHTEQHNNLFRIIKDMLDPNIPFDSHFFEFQLILYESPKFFQEFFDLPFRVQPNAIEISKTRVCNIRTNLQKQRNKSVKNGLMTKKTVGRMAVLSEIQNKPTTVNELNKKYVQEGWLTTFITLIVDMQLYRFQDRELYDYLSSLFLFLFFIRV